MDFTKPRPTLIFNHNPKAGGGSIEEILDSFKKCKIKTLQHYYTNNKDCFIVVKEFDHTTYRDRQHGFVIGSVREPCSQYLSLWSFGSHGFGRFMNRNPVLRNYLGKDEPFFNSTSDISKFQYWIQHPVVTGIVANRFKHSYGESLEGVDCWVYVEKFQESLLHCLRLYEAQGGHGDWNAKEIKELVRIAHEKEGTRKLSYKHDDKNDPLGNPQIKSHGTCSQYYSPELSQWMTESGPETFIYNTFGYHGCCSHERTDTVIPNEFILPMNASVSSLPSSIVKAETLLKSPLERGDSLLTEPKQVVFSRSFSPDHLTGLILLAVSIVAAIAFFPARNRMGLSRQVRVAYTSENENECTKAPKEELEMLTMTSN